MKILPGPASQNLGSKIATSLNIESNLIKFKKFPDGEHYIKIEGDLKNQDVIIIQTTSYPQNDNLFDLFLIIESLIQLDPRSISVIIPYLAYSRQDKRFLEGESLSSKLISQIIENISENKAKFFITFDIHSGNIKNFFKKFQFINVSAIPLIANYLKKYDLMNPVVIAPDKGALDKAKELGDLLNTSFTHLEKKRSKTTGEIETTVKDLSVEGKDVVFIDDIISTGGTMIKGINMAISQGARDVYVACTHPVLINNAKNKIIKAGAKEIIGTDSIPSDCSKVSLASAIIELLKEKF